MEPATFDGTITCPWSAGLLKDSLTKSTPPIGMLKFYANIAEGLLVGVHQKFNFSKKDRRWEIREETEPKNGSPVFTFDEYRTIYETSAREQVSIMEAMVLVHGESNLAPSWVDKALSGPRYVAGEDCLPDFKAPANEQRDKSKELLSKIKKKKAVSA